MTEWMDAQLAAEKRMFMTFSTTNLHMDYYFPYEPVSYTKLSRPNLYLNALKWTDDVFGRFLDLLDTRGLLENSLVIVLGDHGPHLSTNGDLRFGPHDTVFKVPLAMRMPNGAFRARVPNSDPFTSIDVLPTVLDALGVDASLIRPYPGPFHIASTDDQSLPFHRRHPRQDHALHSCRSLEISPNARRRLVRLRHCAGS